ncbi:carboxypeptidase Q-like isoform X1 [Folsomia candida]|uniref:carboxypeptidase Q-like isoform X1 n=1 Tax=Folsomia candida TaxID=158441 RepID=UPI001604CE35|nr:carboxypeptidase Q-like isoform X1 [Folsomia candida]
MSNIATQIFHIFFLLCFCSEIWPITTQKNRNPSLQQGPCNLPSFLITEIQNYQPIADEIMNAAISGAWKGRTFEGVTTFVDKYVNRLSGTPELEESIDYMMEKMIAAGLDNVRGEDVQVPRWIRGEEKATLVEPVVKTISILGVGPSVGTPIGGISSEVIVVRSFDELDEKKDEILGKIVVYNQGWLGSYVETSQYRGNGPTRASAYGAVAALIESATPYSLYTVHTGGIYYGSTYPRIPAACITREDAEFLFRVYSRGELKKSVNL